VEDQRSLCLCSLGFPSSSALSPSHLACMLPSSCICPNHYWTRYHADLNRPRAELVGSAGLWEGETCWLLMLNNLEQMPPRESKLCAKVPQGLQEFVRLGTAPCVVWGQKGPGVSSLSQATKASCRTALLFPPCSYFC
jgi:hypothetical protein